MKDEKDEVKDESSSTNEAGAGPGACDEKDRDGTSPESGPTENPSGAEPQGPAGPGEGTDPGIIIGPG